MNLLLLLLTLNRYGRPPKLRQRVALFTVEYLIFSFLKISKTFSWISQYSWLMIILNMIFLLFKFSNNNVSYFKRTPFVSLLIFVIHGIMVQKAFQPKIRTQCQKYNSLHYNWRICAICNANPVVAHTNFLVMFAKAKTGWLSEVNVTVEYLIFSFLKISKTFSWISQYSSDLKSLWQAPEIEAASCLRCQNKKHCHSCPSIKHTRVSLLNGLVLGPLSQPCRKRHPSSCCIGNNNCFRRNIFRIWYIR